MHGVRRGSRPTGAALEAEEARLRRDAAQLRAALAARRNPGPESAKLIESAAETHPDEYSLWAFLREQLLRTSDDKLLPEWESALSLTARALRRHHKAYPAWQQRLWLLGDPQLAERLPKEAHETRLAEERALSEAMLARDGRNFHAWAHRMRLRAATATPDEETLPKELEFVTSKINVDFANYSAWHQRSAILPRMRKHGAPAPPEQVKEELDFVRQAFYTEPDVQSTWFYHRWLLAGMPARGIKATVDRALWESELLACEELLDIEPDARWALHTKAHILAHLRKKDEAVKILQRLQEIDPMRRGFYKYKARKLLTASNN